MLSGRLRQIGLDELASGFEPVAELSRSVAEYLVRAGVTFSDEGEYDEPGPVRWAAVQLEDGTQFVLVHHHAHPLGMVDVRAQPSAVTPAMRLVQLLFALDLMPEVFDISKDWPASRGD